MEYKHYVFDSFYGYSSIFRIGKLYKLHRDHYRFMMTTHEELIDYTSVLKLFFRTCKQKMKIRIGLFYISKRDLHNRELGLHNLPDLFNKYYRLHFGKL